MFTHKKNVMRLSQAGECVYVCMCVCVCVREREREGVCERGCAPSYTHNLSLSHPQTHTHTPFAEIQRTSQY